MTTAKTLTRTVAAALLMLAVAACSSVPAPQVASLDDGIAAQNAIGQGGN